jgi:hypothetical protein
LKLARDRAGKKPLYYSTMGGVFSFSSEIKALLELPWIKKELDEEALYHFLTFNHVDAPSTFFKGIKKLGAGEYMTVSNNGIVEMKSYYDINYQNLTSSSEKLIEDTLFEKLYCKYFLDPKFYLCQSNEDRDPISMNLFWEEENGIKKVVYPDDNFINLVIYKDSKNIVRCIEIESLKYLKTYNLIMHPISQEEIPSIILDKIEKLDISKIENNKTIENMALDIFQYFSKISIFINYESFLQLNKSELFKFNFELRDFWLQNFSKKQRNDVSSDVILSKDQNSMEEYNLEDIQKYLLSQLKVLLSCEKEEYKYMINYIIVGALGIVIPEIKEMYPDFCFSF